MNEHHDDESAMDALAGYLGDEMSDPARSQFEAAMVNDASLAAEARGLRSALEAMRSLSAPAIGSSAGLPIPTHSRGRIGPAALRYAAAAALAFSAGYFMRGRLTAPSTDSPRSINSIQSAAAPTVSQAQSSETMIARLAQAYASARSESSLARSLAALSTISSARQFHAEPADSIPE